MSEVWKSRKEEAVEVAGRSPFFFQRQIGALFFTASLYASVTQFHNFSFWWHEPDTLASRRRRAEVDSVVLFVLFCLKDEKKKRASEEEVFLKDAAVVAVNVIC